MLVYQRVNLSKVSDMDWANSYENLKARSHYNNRKLFQSCLRALHKIHRQLEMSVLCSFDQH